jgi:hypothetical protein
VTVEFSIELDTHELLLVLGIFGPCIVMGVEDPYLGVMSEEVRISQHLALDSLMMRGLVRAVSEDKIDLIDQVSTTASIMHHPNHSLIVHSKQMAGSDFHCYIHFAGERIVQHTPSQDQHRLILAQNMESLLDDLEAALRAASKAESSCSPFNLTEEVMFEARRLCARGDLNEARARLLASELPSEAIDPLIHALIKPVATSSFVLVVNRNNIESQYVRGFSVLEGVDEMWIMEPFEEEGIAMVTFLAANAKKVRERFFEILPWR